MGSSSWKTEVLCSPAVDAGRVGGSRTVKGWLSLIVGILMVLAGLVWTLQGLDVMGGSAMSGNTMWAVIGPIVGIIGLGLVGFGVRSLRSRTSTTV
jgi:hypothetical protein